MRQRLKISECKEGLEGRKGRGKLCNYFRISKKRSNKNHVCFIEKFVKCRGIHRKLLSVLGPSNKDICNLYVEHFSSGFVIFHLYCP